MSQILDRGRYEELVKSSGGDFDARLFAVILIAFMTRQHIVISTEEISYATKSIQLVRLCLFSSEAMREKTHAANTSIFI